MLILVDSRIGPYQEPIDALKKVTPSPLDKASVPDTGPAPYQDPTGTMEKVSPQDTDSVPDTGPVPYEEPQKVLGREKHTASTLDTGAQPCQEPSGTKEEVTPTTQNTASRLDPGMPDPGVRPQEPSGSMQETENFHEEDKH